ncbi:hypothetical protein [Helicobacter felis]|uniref:hypothetical protein n=1 Tax=Helicobacter felis TaxID=214 RepID=UPI000EF64285|nr:hypothetical protein [Helicobacter felis]
MKIFKSCSVVLGGCLLTPMLSGCLGGLLGNSQPQETPNQILQKNAKSGSRLGGLRGLNNDRQGSLYKHNGSLYKRN